MAAEQKPSDKIFLLFWGLPVQGPQSLLPGMPGLTQQVVSGHKGIMESNSQSDYLPTCVLTCLAVPYRLCLDWLAPGAASCPTNQVAMRVWPRTGLWWGEV